MRLIIFLLCLVLATAVALLYLDTTDDDVRRAIERYSKELGEETQRSGKDTGQSVEEINERLQKLREEAERMRLKANEALDPDFERKTADIIGLYLDPPRHAAVFCVDEKTAIQALDRRDRVLPLSPGRAERHGFEYKRNGTLSLYAALNTKTGQVHGKTAARHTSQDFVEFLGEVVARCEPDQEIHIILDNLSATRPSRWRRSSSSTPTSPYTSRRLTRPWLNQVELWFSKLQRDVIARGVFTSTADLARKLRRYINAYSKDAKPFRWKYSKPSRRIRHGKTISATVH